MVTESVGKLRGRPPAGSRPRDLRRTLIDAALQLIERTGVEALSVREAARVAGVTHQAPYRHFANKQELIAAIAEEGFHALREKAVRATAEHPDDPLARLDAMALTYFVFAVEQPAQFRVMFGPEVADKAKYPALRASADVIMAMLTQLIAENQRSGRVRAGDPLDLALAGWSMMHGLASLIVNGPVARYPQGSLAPRDLARSMIGLLHTGLDVR